MAARGDRPKVLVVEDEFLLAEEIAVLLVDQGYSVVGPYGHLSSAMQAAGSAHLDAALLDLRVNGGATLPVADTLKMRKVPFGFVTANRHVLETTRHRAAPVADKPVQPESLKRLLTTLLA